MYFMHLQAARPMAVSGGEVQAGQIIAANGQTYSVMPQAAATAIQMQIINNGEQILYIPSGGVQAAHAQQYVVSLGIYNQYPCFDDVM